jgi:hypothetical protein
MNIHTNELHGVSTHDNKWIKTKLQINYKSIKSELQVNKLIVN